MNPIAKSDKGDKGDKGGAKRKVLRLIARLGRGTPQG